MEVYFGEEDDDGIGLRIIDNNGGNHGLHISYEGKITYHSCEDYPNNPAKRTRSQSEYGLQARRFARWNIYRRQGYDTVPPTENPDCIMAALLAITKLSVKEFTKYFGNLKDQLQSHYDGSNVDLPFPDADPDDAIIYQKDIYLEPDPIDFDPPVLDQFLDRFVGDPDSPAVTDMKEITVETLDDLEFEIEAVSEMHVLHNDGQGNEQVVHGEQPLERDPDARIELMAFDTDSVDNFQHYLVSHLAYQIRDRFLLMGVKPPTAFRAQGWGTYEGFQSQKFCDLYEDYWSSKASITSWEPY